MQIIAIEPHIQLQPYVLSYRIIEDWLGDFAGVPIWTCPEPVGVLSANFGRLSYHESGVLHPKIGLLGVQTRIRQWLSQPETSFVMAILTVPGMMTLFPDIGQDSADNLLDVGGAWGDRRANEFWRCLPQGLQPDTVKVAMDRWFFNALSVASETTKKRHLLMYQAITSNKRIDKSCDQLGVTQRTLQREFRRHLGVSPKKVASLHRLQHSIRANLESVPDNPIQEFSDQAHEIRTWRRHLDRTPSQYHTENRSPIAKAFASSASSSGRDPTIFYL